MVTSSLPPCCRLGTCCRAPRTIASHRCARRCWPLSAPRASLPEASRRNYRTVAAPGTPSGTATDGLAEPAGAFDDGVGNFMRVEVDVAALEWLRLHPAGNRRARFTPDTGTWLVP